MRIDTQKNQSIEPERNSNFYNFLKVMPVKEKVEVLTVDDTYETQELLENIKNAKKEWESANLNFEYAYENEIIDYYTYRIKASEVMYEYLIRKAKEKGIRVELLGHNGSKFKNESSDSS